VGRHTIDIVLMLCTCTSGDHIGATLMHKLAAFAAVGPDALSAPLLPALVRTQAGSAPTPASPGCTDCEHAGQTYVSQVHVWVIIKTLVNWLQVRKFRDRVAAELPGLYTWFDDSSLHVTLRALT
jgi:hypothetical protein